MGELLQMKTKHSRTTGARRVMPAFAIAAVVFATCGILTPTDARAQGCGLGGAVSAADTSTSQTLELIRDRRIQVAQSCPAGTAPSASGMCVPTATGTNTPTSAQQPAVAQPQPKAAPKRAPGAAPSTSPTSVYGSLKDDPGQPPIMRRYGVWAEGYGDYERRTDVTPAGQTVRFNSYGVLSGIDHTYLHAPGAGILIGALAGYNDTHGRFSGDVNLQARTQDIDGAMLGLYGTYFHRGFAADLLVKVDLFDLEQRAIGCGASGSADLTNFTIAGNLYHRRSMGHFWLEPTIGLRYIHSDLGSGAAALGLGDGEVLRLQGGVRIGSDWLGIDRRLWSVSFLAGLYSDVIVNGFVAGGAGAAALETDEGRVRALGQLRAQTTTMHGVSLFGQAEVRGGEDYFGATGKLGVRYDW
jgi:outer membrane autotransporter protein